MASEVLTVSQLRKRKCGTVRGHVSGTANKTILYDSSDKIELLLFGEVPLKPGVLYEVRVEELLLGDCIPVKSLQDIRVVDDPGVARIASNGGDVEGKHGELVSKCLFYITEKSNKIKQSRFFVNTLLCYTPDVCCESDVTEVYIQNIKAEWFSYLIPGHFYLVMSDCGFSFISASSNSILDLRSIYPDKFSFIHLTNDSGKVLPFSKASEIITGKISKREHKILTTFSKLTDIKDSFSFISVRAEVLGISSFEKSGFITFVDSHSNIENIAFTPARRILPKFLVPGAVVVMYKLSMKSVHNGTRHFLSVTHLTQIYLQSLPGPSDFISNISPLNHIRTLQQKSGVINVIVSIDCILSLSINTFDNVHCRLSIRDNSDTATLHIRENSLLLAELFSVTAQEQEFLKNIRNFEHGKVDGSEGGKVLCIFSRVLRSGRRFYIRGDVRVDSCQYLVQTQYGKIPKCPRIHVFPYMLRTVSPVQELRALLGR